MMISSSLRLQIEMRGLVTGFGQFNISRAINPSVNLFNSNRQFSGAPVEIPKRPVTPWINYYKSSLPEFRRKHPGAKVSDLMSKISEEWKKLPAEKKRPMEAKYEAEKVKYQSLMDKVPEEVKEQARAEKRQKRAIASGRSAAVELKEMLDQLGKPKRPLTSYMLFSVERRARMTASERQKAPADVVRMLGAEWKAMSDAQKQPFLDKYGKIKNEHDRAMERWTQKMSKEGKMSGILAAQARVAHLKEH